MNWLSQAAGSSPQSRPRTFNWFSDHLTCFFCTLSINPSFSACWRLINHLKSAPWCQGNGLSARQPSASQSVQMNTVPYPVLQRHQTVLRWFIWSIFAEMFLFYVIIKQAEQGVLPSSLHPEPSREREMRTSRRSPSLAVPYSRPCAHVVNFEKSDQGGLNHLACPLPYHHEPAIPNPNFWQPKIKRYIW